MAQSKSEDFQALVGLYRSRASKTGASLPSALSDLQLAAGGAFATTLEVLIIPRALPPSTGDEPSPCTAQQYVVE